MKRHPGTTFLLFLVGVALLYAVGIGANRQQPTPVRAPAQRLSASGLTARDLRGASWRLSDERGQVVLVNYWATWCPPCRGETPDLVRVANAYAGKGLAVVGVSMDEGDGEEIRRFVVEYRVPYRIVRRLAAGTPTPFSVAALPTTFLIDRKGRIANVYEGAVSEASLRNTIDALLAEH